MKRILWAKKNRVNNIPMWLPLKVHLKDTMEVCGLLWEHWLSEGVKNFIADSLQLESKAKSNDSQSQIKDRAESIDKFTLSKNLCRFLGAVHDIGKATPIFQVKKSFYNDSVLDKLIIDKLKGAGFKDIDEYALKKIKNIPHNKSGQYILTKYGINFCVANIIGAHHGSPVSRFDSDDSISFESSYYQVEDKKSDIYKNWEKIQKNYLDWALKECEFSSSKDLPLISQQGQVILSRLLIMADWIASNEKYFPLINLDENEVSSNRIQEGFIRWQKERSPSWNPQNYYDEMYKERFGFENGPREVQEKIAEEIDKIDEPGIIIIEAPMGIGKTEAALIAVEQFANKTNRTGMFFGLPTQATSNGIFSRVKNWLTKTDEGRSIRLVHGKAQLNDEFNKLPKSNNIHEEDGITVNEWFAGRKVSILDDFVVGTVDQILLASLKQKHLMLRHLGLSNKVIVIDEVHAYDAYMSVYLYQALRWLGAYRVPVVVLSATLPIEKRNELLESYMVGAGYKFKKLNKPIAFEHYESYPLLTFNDGEKIIQFDNFEKQYGKDYEIIKKSKNESDDIISIINQFKIDGGVFGIIVNTVKKAQEFAEKCVLEFGEENVELLHSSFIATDRYKKEKELIATIGKNGNRPKFKIIIGTQVIEQSLDIDFDVMITNLAPMDLILQRMGRLHRHNNVLRPNNLKNPKVIVLNCVDYNFDEGSSYVYDPYILFRTEYNLPDKINLPNDISHLIQLVYSTNALDLKEDLLTSYLEYRCNSEKEVKEKEIKAKTYRIANPKINKISEDKNIADWLTNSNTESEKSEINAYAQVRDSIDTIEVIALKKCEGGYEFFDKKGLLDPNDNKIAMDIAKHTIKLPLTVYYGHGIDRIIYELEKYYLEHFKDWNNQSWLKNNLGIIFDENNEFRILNKVLKYDIKYGLKVEKEVNNE